MKLSELTIDDLLKGWARSFEDEHRAQMADQMRIVKAEQEQARKHRQMYRDEIARRCGEDDKAAA